MKNTFKLFLTIMMMMVYTTSFAALVKYENKDTDSAMYGSYTYDTVTKLITSYDLTVNLFNVGGLEDVKLSSKLPIQNPDAPYSITYTAPNHYEESPKAGALWMYSVFSSFFGDFGNLWVVNMYAFEIKYLPKMGVLGYQSDTVFVDFSVAPTVVPEPEIYSMFLMGFGLIGFISRRKFK